MNLKELVDRLHPFPIPIVECQSMVGAKKAIWDGMHLYVSPAMRSLLSDPGDDGTMGLIGAAIEVTHFPLPSFALNLMTTQITATRMP